MSILRQTGGLGAVIKMIVGATMEKSVCLLRVASPVKVGPNQFPRIKGMIDRAYRYCKATLEQSDDLVLKAIRGVGGALGDATKGVREAIKHRKNP